MIYTGDVDDAEPDFETACFTLHTEQAFLAHIDGEAALQKIQEKLSVEEGLAEMEIYVENL